jgi:folate-binding protein YgfZ
MAFFISPLENRIALKITGNDRMEFLQGISSADLTHVSKETGVYTCFLTPQGKFLYDMFIVAVDDDVWLADVEKDTAALLIAHLAKYKLRADIAMEPADDMALYAFYGGAISTQITEMAYVYNDPRLPELGWRCFMPLSQEENIIEEVLKLEGEQSDFENYDTFRISQGVPDGRRDIMPEKMHLIEAHIQYLNGISFDKGCYTGQELTARVYHRGRVKKSLLPVRLMHPVASGDTVFNLDGDEIGLIHSHTERYAMAYVKLEPARLVLAGADKVRINDHEADLFKPDWLTI